MLKKGFSIIIVISVFLFSFGYLGNYENNNFIDRSYSLEYNVILYDAGGNSSGIVLDTNGDNKGDEIWTWGDNTYGQLGRETNGDFSYAPTVINTNGNINLNESRQVIDFEIGSYNMGVVVEDTSSEVYTYEVWMWGSNSKGQLGSLTVEVGFYSSTPVQVYSTDMLDTGDKIVEFDIGGEFAGVVIENSDGSQEIWTWGANDSGQLGNGTTADSIIPVQVNTWSALNTMEDTVLFFELGSSHAGIVVGNPDGSEEIWMWGSNTSGQLGTGSRFPTFSRDPVFIDDTEMLLSTKSVVDFSLGNSHTGVVLDTNNDGQGEEIWMWGDNTYGQLANLGGAKYKLSPTQVGNTILNLGGNRQVIDIDLGGNTSGVVIDTNGDGFGEEIWMWGSNESGQLGIGTNIPYSPVPIQVDNTDMQLSETYQVSGIAIGANHTLTIAQNFDTLSKEFWSWGSNTYGQLGFDVNSGNDTSVPNRVYGFAYPEIHSFIINDVTDDSMTFTLNIFDPNDSFDETETITLHTNQGDLETDSGGTHTDKGNYTYTVSGLESNTEYIITSIDLDYFGNNVSVGEINNNGQNITFTTKPAPLSVDSIAVNSDSVTPYSFEFTISVTDEGETFDPSESITISGDIYDASQQSQPVEFEAVFVGGDPINENYTYRVTGLTPDSLYSFDTISNNQIGIVDIATINGGEPLIVSTAFEQPAVTSITVNSATTDSFEFTIQISDPDDIYIPEQTLTLSGYYFDLNNFTPTPVEIDVTGNLTSYDEINNIYTYEVTGLEDNTIYIFNILESVQLKTVDITEINNGRPIYATTLAEAIVTDFSVIIESLTFHSFNFILTVDDPNNDYNVNEDSITLLTDQGNFEATYLPEESNPIDDYYVYSINGLSSGTTYTITGLESNYFGTVTFEEPYIIRTLAEGNLIFQDGEILEVSNDYFYFDLTILDKNGWYDGESAIRLYTSNDQILTAYPKLTSSREQGVYYYGVYELNPSTNYEIIAIEYSLVVSSDQTMTHMLNEPVNIETKAATTSSNTYWGLIITIIVLSVLLLILLIAYLIYVIYTNKKNKNKLDSDNNNELEKNEDNDKKPSEIESNDNKGKIEIKNILNKTETIN